MFFVNFISFSLSLLSVIVFCYFRLMNFTMRKNRLNAVYASDSIQPERLPVSLEVSRIYF